jgi:hypothetical protein
MVSRGAGILCANNQYAIDGINPFLYDGGKLGLNNLGLILWQGKSDSAFTATPRQALFDIMDVYKLGILGENEKPVPLIKIVFALAARSPSLTVVRCPPATEYNAVVFVYEIWCPGLSPDILSAIEHSQVAIWTALLQASYGPKSIYTGSSVDKELRRLMNPGAGTDVGHWHSWAEQTNKQRA